jgi:hypothetical protein
MSVSELKLLKELKLKSEESWLQDIAQLPEEMQNPIGKIVWWDFFASRTGDERAVGFSRFLPPDKKDYPNDSLRDGLIAVGYPENYASSRVLGKGLSRQKEY